MWTFMQLFGTLFIYGAVELLVVIVLRRVTGVPVAVAVLFGSAMGALLAFAFGWKLSRWAGAFARIPVCPNRQCAGDRAWMVDTQSVDSAQYRCAYCGWKFSYNRLTDTISVRDREGHPTCEMHLRPPGALGRWEVRGKIIEYALVSRRAEVESGAVDHNEPAYEESESDDGTRQ